MKSQSKLAIPNPAPRLTIRYLSALCVLLLCTLLVLPRPSQAAVALLTVGGDAACDFRTDMLPNALQNAIDAVPTSVPPTDLYVIRVARSGNYVGVQLDSNGRDFLMEGGYASCDSADYDVDNTVIDANGSPGPVFLINNAIQRKRVSLANLTLTGGLGVQAAGLAILNSDVDLRRVTITDNNSTGTSGGGIYINGEGLGASLDLRGGSIVSNNATDQDGGGIYCANGARLTLQTESAVVGNEADSGGGILIDGCNGYINSGANGLLGLFRNIGSNSASFGGGGLYLRSNMGPTDIVIGEGLGADDPRPIFMLNSADVQGGGIMAIGDDTRLTLRNALISSNTSGSLGGGIQARNGSTVLIERTLARCGESSGCSSIILNEADYGGAIALAGEGTNVVVRGTRISQNTAILRGSAVFNQQGNARILLESVLIDDNTGLTVIHASAPGSAAPLATLTEIVGSTIVDNNSPGTMLNVHAEGDALITLSIIRESAATDVFAYTPPNTPFVECSLLHSTDSLPGPIAGVVANASPGFINAAAGDYHLTRMAAGVDRCASRPIFPLRDFDLQPRPYDVPEWPNLAGPWDVGAFETNDRLFADGFEGGG